MLFVAKIFLFLLLATSLQASTDLTTYTYEFPNGNLIFNQLSYENRSHVYMLCEEGYRRSTQCVLKSVSGNGDEAVACSFLLITNRNPIQPRGLQVLRFGPDKAIVSWIEEGSSLSQWRLAVINFKDCSLNRPNLHSVRKLWPLSFVVHENTFGVVVTSDQMGRCHRSATKSLDVPRCYVEFDDQCQLVERPNVWFYEAVRDDDLMVVPLARDDPGKGYLLIDVYFIKRTMHTVARFSLLDLEGNIAKLTEFTVLDDHTSDMNPKERIAYSTANGFIGVCVQTAAKKLMCGQFDWKGVQLFETTLMLQYENFDEFMVTNLAGSQGGMLLLTAECEESDCQSPSNLYHVSRIDARGKLWDGTYAFDKFECDTYTNRANGQFYEPSAGEHCFTQVCYEDFLGNHYKDQNQTRTRSFRLGTHCFTEKELAAAQHKEHYSVFHEHFAKWFIRS